MAGEVDTRTGEARLVTRPRVRLVAIAIAALLVALTLYWISSRALLAPRTLELWGHDFNADGNAQVYEKGENPPWPNEPISLRAVLERDPEPVIVHQTSGPLLIGLQVIPMPKPSQAPRAIYLQVGTDAYVPYYWANNCCMPSW
jgi:hypothetical protein